MKGLILLGRNLASASPLPLSWPTPGWEMSLGPCPLFPKESTCCSHSQKGQKSPGHLQTRTMTRCWLLLMLEKLWPESEASSSEQARRDCGHPTPTESLPFLTLFLLLSPYSSCSRQRSHSSLGHVSIVKNNSEPWLVWLSGLSAGMRTKESPVQFPVRTRAWVAGQVPSRERMRGNLTLMFLSLSFSLLSPLSRNK